MTEQLSWRVEASTLSLQGELDRETLLALWQQRDTVMKQIDTIDVSALDRVDSAGLALLVHLRQMLQQQGKTPLFTGVTDKLLSLINLYNLQQIIVSPADS
ncbi:lipid asymmetry maintenance protein MlaB [Erwiniaceae bacterium BAC15a-03b]|uniref:Lipid asymmetry maintenance protein MlaB n=1 Tax=Winslowiella arboricola TaxID=2978220 RepID=A0A9J6PJ54_9GAMM|nr:lipid asymmetry maintenance protein MlaB [Winslowiella arboricola]MCU5773426.1 lipid asymmetry maintenance protein MlaB [Winslowiella arboricola]MCU5776750.1 lipid asymmetry maintenance protein MlaB [Winslowiella arboricola]